MRHSFKDRWYEMYQEEQEQCEADRLAQDEHLDCSLNWYEVYFDCDGKVTEVVFDMAGASQQDKRHMVGPMSIYSDCTKMLSVVGKSERSAVQRAVRWMKNNGHIDAK